MKSDAEFLNLVRAVLGLCPLPHSSAAAKEAEAYRRQRELDIGWPTFGDGTRRARRVGSETRRTGRP